MGFFESLTNATQAERVSLLTIPQIRDGLSGRISLSTYVAYLAQAYHHVKHTVPLLYCARARLDETHATFRDALTDYIAEETGHEEWILSDIAHCRGDADAVRASDPAPATEMMVSFAYDYVNRVNPMGLFGMIYVLEGTSVALASTGAKAVAQALSLSPDCFTYLNTHGALDQEHVMFFSRLMEKVNEERDRAAIIHVAKRVYYLFGEMFRSIPHSEVAHAA